MKKILETLQDVRFYFVLISLTSLYLLIDNSKMKSRIVERDVLQYKVDSLIDEINVREIELGSYQYMWEILEEVNRPLADSINLMVE